jgi:hypothetical protein
MSVQFWPCPGCSRHVKRGDPVCPFCGATASLESGPTRVLVGRLSRAAIFAAGAMGAAVATTNCNSAPVPPSQPMLQPMYGGSTPLDDGSLSGQPAYGGSPLVTVETEDSGASDGPSEAVPDAVDASADTAPTDSANTSDDAADAPILLQQAYGGAILQDE